MLNNNESNLKQRQVQKMPMISGEAPFMRLLGITRCARGLGDFYLSACDRSRDVKVKHFLECEPDITVISTNPIRVSKFSNVQRQLSNERRRDVATTTAKLLGITMDIGSLEEEEEEPKKEQHVSISFSPAKKTEYENLGLFQDADICAPILPSLKKKKIEENSLKDTNLVQRFREFSTTKDVLKQVPSRDTMPRTPPIMLDQKKAKEKERPDLSEPRQRLLTYVSLCTTVYFYVCLSHARTHARTPIHVTCTHIDQIRTNETRSCKILLDLEKGKRR